MKKGEIKLYEKKEKKKTHEDYYKNSFILRTILSIVKWPMRFMVRYDIKIRRKVFETFLKMEDTMDKKVHEIYCNSCGKKIETTDNIKREDYLSIKKEWGYFSKKDGEIHSIFLCESCYDIWTKQFKLPVKVEEQTELL